MATPAIRVAPATVLASASGYEVAISGENISPGTASALEYTPAIGGYICQNAGNGSHTGIGTTQNVTLTNHAKRGPDHISCSGMTVWPLNPVGSAWSMGCGGSGNRWYMGTADNSQQGWQQRILDPTSTPDVGSARTIGQGTNPIFMAYDVVGGGESMFEAFAAGHSWVGKHIEIDGGTALDPIDFSGVSTEDNNGSTRSAGAPYIGHKLGHVQDVGGGNIELQGPVIIGHADGTTATYFKDVSGSIFCNAENRVNDLWYYIETQGNTTVIFGESDGSDSGSISGGSTKKLRLDTATAEPTGGFFSYNRTWSNGRDWGLGSNSEFHGGALNNIDNIAINALTKLLAVSVSNCALKYAASFPATGLLTDSTFSTAPATNFCIEIGDAANRITDTALTIDFKFPDASYTGSAIKIWKGSQNLEITFGSNVGDNDKIDLTDITVDATGGTVSFPAGAATLTLSGVPSGVKVIIVNSTTRAILLPLTTSTGADITYGHSGGETVDILFNSTTYDPNVSDVFDFTLPGTDTTIQPQFFIDGNYANP